MGTVTTEQQKLVLNSFAMVLQNNLVTASAVSWNEYDGEMDDRNGLQVLEQITPRYNVTRTENGVKDLSAGTDGTVFGSELFEVTGTFNANMGWGDFVKIKSIGEARESKALLGAATSMAEKIDAYIMEKAVLASADWLGDGITSIDEWVDAAAAYTRLKENGVDDSDLSYIMNYTDQMKLGDQVVKLPAPDAFTTSTYRKGFMGELNGIRTMFTNQLPVMTTGTRTGTGANVMEVNGANQNVNYADVARAGSVNGRHMTQTLNISDATTATATFAVGEVFTIAGVFAYDNRKQAAVTPARLQQFTVVAAATAVAGNVALTIFPAIIVPGSGSGDNININTAHATVTAAPADNADITFLGAASTALSPRVLIQKQAVVVNTVPLILPASDTSMRRRLTKIPLTVRMWQHSDFYTGEHGVRFDVALNANVRERMRIARVNGS
jgi:P22 coat protein - gene protein 5